MSYKTNSPVKQVWLPLDYTWLNEAVGQNFGNFSKDYKERYGIDLHDLFELKQNLDGYLVSTKVDLIGAYTDNFGGYGLRMANPSVFTFVNNDVQGDSPVTLANITIQDYSKGFGHGFNILLPAVQTPVNSIDDLEVTFYEL